MNRSLFRTTLLVALLGFSTASFACPDCRAALAARSQVFDASFAPHLLVMFIPFILMGALAASLHRWPRRRRHLRGLAARAA